MKSAKKAVRKNAKTKAKETAPVHTVRMLFAGYQVQCDLDMAFIAEHRPKMVLNDLVVLAMAMGGRIHVEKGTAINAGLLNLKVRFDLPAGPSTADIPVENGGKCFHAARVRLTGRCVICDEAEAVSGR